MLQLKFQVAACLRKQIGINKPNLYNTHEALVVVQEWVYDVVCTFPPGILSEY